MDPSELDSFFNALDLDAARLLLEMQEDTEEFLRKCFENFDKDVENLLKSIS